MNNLVKNIAGKEKLVIAVTDSGLGGLNVVPRLEKLFTSSKAIKEVELIFVNALLHPSMGYNKMKNMDEKSKVFNSVLEGINKWYHPDLLLIACNTLSVVYEQTHFYKNPFYPVIGIVDTGVELLIEKMKDKTSKAIILGTPTTISGEVHKQKLIKAGIDESRIIAVPCPMLESEIQSAPGSDKVKRMIAEYVGTALKDKSIDSKIYPSLCCTHYEYSLKAFESFFSSVGFDYEIINPNEKLAENLRPALSGNKYEQTHVKIKVVTKNAIAPPDIEAVNPLLEMNSVKTAEALHNYELKPDLFDVEFDSRFNSEEFKN
ncbi:MAG: aspartate/glutamate racemase family protein [Desulfobulbaceae bacterium]|nr:aspartate/glutamate racemase family protein [Desulfobulbaceae bacterium]